MPLPIRFLIGSPRRLFGAIVLFVALDLTVLVFNLWIAEQVAEDAVAINLAGRQRMLSQQISKSLLLSHYAQDASTNQDALGELSKAFALFETTLAAFSEGGHTQGGAGQPVWLNRVDEPDGRKPIERVLVEIAPLAEKLRPLVKTGQISVPERALAVRYMTDHNREILKQMNLLTTALERHSVQRIQGLRAIQTGAFLLALANFLVIVLGLVKQYKHVEEDGQRWREQAERDSLTKLHNRAAFMAALGSAVAKAATTEQTLCVLMLDLGGFKPINDQFGHAAGDTLLCKVAEALQQVARETDTVARLGGDEFAVLCPNLHNQANVEHFCDRLVASIDALAHTHGEQAKVRSSIGAAVYPAHGTSAAELLAAADKAMYKSKQQGGGQWGMAVLNR